MDRLTVTEIVRRWLRANGYDGLYFRNGDLECRCGIDGGIARCGNTFPFDCVPAVKLPDGLLYPAGTGELVAQISDTEVNDNDLLTVVDIVRQWLLANGYDGLYNDLGDSCGCGADRLAPCVAPHGGCVAAVMGPDGFFYPDG